MIKVRKIKQKLEGKDLEKEDEDLNVVDIILLRRYILLRSKKKIRSARREFSKNIIFVFKRTRNFIGKLKEFFDIY